MKINRTNTAHHYYPFGMLMPTRTWDAESSYRFGFNGMEKDDEMKGAGNSYTTEFRQHDPRIGRWFSTDPKFDLSPWNGAYVCVSNNPIFRIDPQGDTDFQLSSNGKIKKIGPDTKDGKDRLIAGKVRYDKKTHELKNSKFIEVDKGILDKVEIKNSKNDKNEVIDSWQQLDVTNETQANDLYKFISKNTGVEIGFTQRMNVKTGESLFSITTSSQLKHEAGGKYLTSKGYNEGKDLTLISYTHDHKLIEQVTDPKTGQSIQKHPSPNPSSDDEIIRNDAKKNYPNAQFNIWYKNEKYPY